MSTINTSRSSSVPLRAECSNVSSNNMPFPSHHGTLTPFTVYTVHKSTQFAFTRVNQSEMVAENGRSWATMRWNGSTSLQEREGIILNLRKLFHKGKEPLSSSIWVRHKLKSSTASICFLCSSSLVVWTLHMPQPFSTKHNSSSRIASQLASRWFNHGNVWRWFINTAEKVAKQTAWSFEQKI